MKRREFMTLLGGAAARQPRAGAGARPAWVCGPAARQRPICSPMDPVVQVLELALQVRCQSPNIHRVIRTSL
jgi:hypothetical protein